MDTLLSYCGLVVAKIRASDNDLPVIIACENNSLSVVCLLTFAVQIYNVSPKFLYVGQYSNSM